MLNVERHTLPNGDVIFFKEYTTPEEQAVKRDHHSYWEGYDGKDKCSGRIPGASTVSKNDGHTDPSQLMDFAAVKCGYEGVAREASLGLSLDDPNEIRTALQWLRSRETIDKTLKEEGSDWRSIRNEKGRIGWQAHDVLERLTKGETPEPTSPYDEAVINWWNDRAPEPLQSEQVVYSKKHNFAGRFDLRCGIGQVDSFAPVVWLVDVKSSNFIANAFAVQLNLYDLAAIECGIGGADHLVILKVNDDATYQEIEVPNNFDWALGALATYNHGKAIGAALRSAQKA